MKTKIRTRYRQRLNIKGHGNDPAEIAQWVALKSVTPQGWLERVLSLPERCQGAIARMIWWDFWSERTVADRWTEFDRWLSFDKSEEENPVETSVLAECLKLVGYPQYRINMRLMAF